MTADMSLSTCSCGRGPSFGGSTGTSDIEILYTKEAAIDFVDDALGGFHGDKSWEIENMCRYVLGDWAFAFWRHDFAVPAAKENIFLSKTAVQVIAVFDEDRKTV